MVGDAGNDLGGTVEMSGGTVAITDANALTLGTVAAGQLTATSGGRLDLGTTDVSGALVAHSSGGAIEQGGALRVGGATELDAGPGDVVLPHAGNDFVGTLGIPGGSVAIVYAIGLTLGTVTADQLPAHRPGQLDLVPPEVSADQVGHGQGLRRHQGK